MIRLHQENLQTMYPGMSAEFTARMDALVHALPAAKEEKPMKRISRTLILAAALLLTALSTTAYALTRPDVLDWLLGIGGSGSTELETTAQDIRAEASADGMTARITSLVYDGNQLVFSYELENADPAVPVVVVLDSAITLNGKVVSIPHFRQDRNGQLVPCVRLDMVPVQRNPVPGGSWCSDLPEGLSGMVQGEVTFIVYRPEKAFAYLVAPGAMWLDETIDSPDALADIADVRATLERFTNTIIVEGDDPSALAAQGYTVIASSPVFEAADQHSHLQETARIRVPFTFDADNAIAYDFSGTAADFADFTVNAAAFRLTPLQTYADVRLIPRENTQTAALALAERCGAYTLTDESGLPVLFSDMDYCSDPDPYVTCMDGQWLCRYLIDMPGLQTFPASIGFTVQGGELLRFDLTAE